MQDKPARRWVRYISLALWVIVVFILLAFTINLFDSSISSLFSWAAAGDLNKPFSYDPELPSELLGSVKDEQKQTFEILLKNIKIRERSITVNSSTEGLQINFRLVIPKENPDIALFLNNWSGSQTVLTEVLFGELQVDFAPLAEKDFQLNRWEVDPTSGALIVTLRAEFTDISNPVVIHFRESDSIPIQPEVDKLLVQMADSALTSMDPVPDAANQEKATLVKRAPEELPNIRLEIERLGVVRDDERIADLGMSRRSFLLRVSTLLNDLPPISQLLFAFTKSAPLLIFIWLAKKTSDNDPKVQALVDLTIGLLFFHFSLYVTEGLVDRLNRVSWFELWGRQWQLFFAHLNPPFLVTLGADLWRIQIVILGLFIPALWIMNRRETSAPGSRRSNWSRIISFFLALTVLAAVIGVVIGSSLQGTGQCLDAVNDLLFPRDALPGSTPPAFAIFTCGIPVWAWSIMIVGALLLVLRWSLGVLLRAVTGERHPLLAWAGAAFLALGVLYRLSIGFHPAATASQAAVWVIYAVLLGIFLLWNFARYVFSFYQRMGWPWKPSGTARRWLFLAAVILAVPARFVFGTTPAAEREFLDLAFYLDDLLIFVWVAGILFLLYEDGKADLKLEPSTRLYGPLALSALLFNPLARWFYIPITFLVGWAALRWLLASGREWGSIEDQFKQMSRVRSRLIAHGSLVRILDQTYLQYRKDRIEKLAKGELKPRKFKTDLNTWEKDQKTASRSPIAKLDQELSKHPLAFGPKATAWQNGLHGAKWAALLALPWFTIYIFDFLQGTSFSSSYPLLDFLIDLLIIFGRWASIGFVLGYFFPYLRGDSGLEKGLWLSFAVIVTSLPLYFLFNESAAEWQVALFWTLQVLIECILLGLIAFDYTTVREERRGFQLLLELHGMRSLSLWAATLIAAIGTSAVTLLSSQAVTLIGLTLKTFLPDAPTDFSPNP